MPGINELLKPQNSDEWEQEMIESLVLSVQVSIQSEMLTKKISQAELADRLDVSPARVSQILSGGGANLTLKTIGRIAFALGEKFDLVTRREAIEAAQQKRKPEYEFLSRVSVNKRRDPWTDRTANYNRFPYNEAKAA